MFGSPPGFAFTNLQFPRYKRKIRTLLQSETGSDFSCLVDPKGIEPSTLRMRTVRAPSCATGPHLSVQTDCLYRLLLSRVNVKLFLRKNKSFLMPLLHVRLIC